MRFLMVGGFLGAGKTTTIARLARRFETLGQRVAIVTNDKASELVDTLNLRGRGLHVGELPGVCFCGNVDELVGMINTLGMAGEPDVVIAEPVGSCLDVAATVLRPLKIAYPQRFEIGPYGVVVKPTHAAKILRGEENAGYSPKAAYLFRKQLEEADFFILNRLDQLSPEQADEIVTLLREQYDDRPVVKTSALTGAGFDDVAEMFDRRGDFGMRSIAIDYDAYGAGEAELGWLNADMLLRRATCGT
ncbi:MAG: GTP-binding protein [Pirellulales bacterium]